MIRGFDHFDGSSRENFAAALLLLCVEEDDGFRRRFAEAIRTLARLPLTSPLTDWGRESTLATEEAARRRCDLWFRFGALLVLVEAKTHSGWDPGHVARQVREQASATLDGNPAHSAILLAPRSLLRRLLKTLRPLPGRT